MTNQNAKNRILKTMKEEGVIINKIAFNGIKNEGDEIIIKKAILSLDAPQDNDIANILRARSYLADEGISLTTVFLEL